MNQNSSTPRRRQSSLWRAAFRQPSVWRRAATLGPSVGALQAAINRGDLWMRHAVDTVVVVKTVVSPLIGFALVLVAAAETWVQRTLEQTKYE